MLSRGLGIPDATLSLCSQKKLRKVREKVANYIMTNLKILLIESYFADYQELLKNAS